MTPKSNTLETVDLGNIPNRYDYDPSPKKNVFSSWSSSLDEYSDYIRIGKIILLNCVIGAYFAWATVYFFQQSEL